MTAFSAQNQQKYGKQYGYSRIVYRCFCSFMPNERRFERKCRDSAPPQKNRRMGGAAAGGKVHSGYSGDRKTLL